MSKRRMEEEDRKQGRKIEAGRGQTEWPKVKSIGTSYFCSLTFSFLTTTRDRQTKDWRRIFLFLFFSTFFLTRRLENREMVRKSRERSTSECCTPHVFQSITKCTLIQSNTLVLLTISVILLSFHFPFFYLSISLLSLSPLSFIHTFTFLFKSFFLSLSLYRLHNVIKQQKQQYDEQPGHHHLLKRS